jgi:hypothetical protein
MLRVMKVIQLSIKVTRSHSWILIYVQNMSEESSMIHSIV